MAAQLFAEVREWVPRERRFQILVLANLCAVIARELRAGEEPSLADVRCSGGCCGATERTMPRARRRGELGRARSRWPRSRRGDLDAARRRDRRLCGEHVERKLEVARPGLRRRIAAASAAQRGRAARGSARTC